MKLTDEGHINLHKTHTPPPPGYERPSDTAQRLKSPRVMATGGSVAWQPNRRPSPYTRPRGRAGKPALNPHRNRTLILNKTKSTSQISKDFAELVEDSVKNSAKSDEDNNSESSKPAMSWVSKRDRHMQLINSSVFDKETQTRNKAIDETRRQKASQKDLRERDKIKRHLAGLSASAPTNIHEISINGLAFQVVNGGSKLLRIQSTFTELIPKCHGLLLIHLRHV